MDIRQTQLLEWLRETMQDTSITLSPLSGDAGFRRYFRFNSQQRSYIAVDAPADKINNAQFVAIAQALSVAKVKVPEIIAYDLTQGRLCLSDLGDNLMATVIAEQGFATCYRQALQTLATIRNLSTSSLSLVEFNSDFIDVELAIFTDWLLDKHLGLNLTADESALITQTFTLLKQAILAQPTAFMHRDYHSRNLIYCNNALAVIDFQDAVIGPISYDMVSLLKDCYYKISAKQREPMIAFCYQQLCEEGRLTAVDYPTFKYWFTLTGAQRHIKAAGIFARLHHRDGKSGYLADIPRTLSYLTELGECYPELSGFSAWIAERVIPALPEVNL